MENTEIIRALIIIGITLLIGVITGEIAAWYWLQRMKKRVGKRGRKGWRKRSPRCTICTYYRWMGNIKGRHPMRELKQLDKEKYDKDDRMVQKMDKERKNMTQLY